MDIYMIALCQSIDMIWQTLGIFTPFIVLYLLWALLRTFMYMYKGRHR